MGVLKLLIPRRRQARPITDEIGKNRANDDIPMAPEVLPGRSDEESERDLINVDRGKGRN